jgi:hypothetical protein
MLRTSGIGVVALSALLAATGAAAQPASPTTYTFVAEWQVPRAEWATYTTDFEKNTRPVLERLSADGTLVGWGAFETVVHTEHGPTHGVWWSSSKVAGIERARAELIKASVASSSLAAATSHRDYYLRTVLGNGKSASGTGGYISVSTYLVKPGKAQEWRQLWEKYSKPTYDDLVAKGAMTAWSIDVEDVHTENPGLRMVVSISPNAEAEDTIAQAFEAAGAKRSAEEQREIGEAFAATLEPGAHRDAYMRLIRYWSK